MAYTFPTSCAVAGVNPSAVASLANNMIGAKRLLWYPLGADKPQQMMFANPAHLLEVFAVELYLKCLLYLDGKDPIKDHDHANLFKQLSPNVQASLRARHDFHMGPIDLSVLSLNSGHNITSKSIEDCLASSGQMFLWLRYGYSGLKLKIGGLYYPGATIRAIVEVIEDPSQQWNQHP